MGFIRHLAILSLLGLLAGCGGAPPQPEVAVPAPARPARRRVIPVIPKATTFEFWKSVEAGARAAGRDFGVEVVWKGPLSEADREAQINLVQDFVTQRVDGICLAPLDSQSLIAPVRAAVAEKIPVLIFDSPLNDAAGTVSFVGTDNRRGGEVAARRLGELLGGQGKVILLRYTPGSQSTELRESGFLETLKAEFPRMQVISDGEYAGATPETALDKAQYLLNQHGGDVDGIFTPCQHVSSGMLKALEERDLAGKVKFVGFDSGPDLAPALRKRAMHGIVLQDPVRMGRLAVETMVAHLDGRKVEPRVSTGEALATPENSEEPAIRALLAPEQAGA